MKTPLLPTQEEDVVRLVDSEDLPNYSMPGTGKTLTTIGAIDRGGYSSALVVAPPIALPMWRDVLAYELGAKVQVLEKGTDKLDSECDAIVCSYVMATKHRRALMGRGCAALVLDESHALKTPDSARTEAVFGPLCDGEGGIYESSKYCYTLTGTPMERYADDLWSQLRAVQPNALAQAGVLTHSQFSEAFTRGMLKTFHPRMAPKWTTVATINPERLNRLLYEDIGVIRRTIHDVVGAMPPVTFREICVAAKLDKETAAFLRGRDVKEIAQMLLDNSPQMGKARRLFGLAKVGDVTQYVLDSAAAGPVLVGYWHTDFGEALTRAVRETGISVQMIGGATEATERERAVAGFNSGEVRVIVGQIAAMGVSLNLQELAAHVIIGEDDWSPSKIEQFYKRVWRLGQTHHVQVDFCKADNVVDEALTAVRTLKEGFIEKVMRK